MVFFRKLKAKRFAATFVTKTVAHAGQEYTVRELAVAERLAFLEYRDENEDALAAAWLVTEACVEFVGIQPPDLMLQCGPSAINVLSEAILDLSGMLTESGDAAQKKSESVPS